MRLFQDRVFMKPAVLRSGALAILLLGASGLARAEIPVRPLVAQELRSILDAEKGRVVVLNLWATWCAPCVKEMPALDRLQKKLGGKDFEVVALSLDRGGAVQVRPFFEERGIGALSVYLDPKSTAMMALKPRGLPTTYLIGRDGRILGTMIGEAEWDGAEAEALIRHYLGTAS